jgi:hypothetical protein
VISALDGEPLTGVRIDVGPLAAMVESDGSGRFEVPALPSGFQRVSVSKADYVMRQVVVRIPNGGETTIRIELEPAAVLNEELLVQPSRVSLLRDQPLSPFSLSRDDLTDLPHLGGDLFRALSLLPGTASADVSAEFNLRGGRRDETQIVLDGQELFDAFHLRDFDNALSTIAVETLDRTDLHAGGFPPRFGDRMSGVLEMRTSTPAGPLRGQLGIGIPGYRAGIEGSIGSTGRWSLAARTGSLDLVGRLYDQSDPRYWDLFAKLDQPLSTRHQLTLQLLQAGDRYDFSEIVEHDRTRVDTDYGNRHVWGTLRSLIGGQAVLETSLFDAAIDRDRSGSAREEDVDFNITDRRDSAIRGGAQLVTWQPLPDHTLALGWQYRRFESRYDYQAERSFKSVLSQIHHAYAKPNFALNDVVSAAHFAVHAADRFRLGEHLTVEVGGRVDRYGLTHETRLSPRINAAWSLGRSSVLRGAWGRFDQSQRAYELEVADGEARFHAVEQSEHQVLGYETMFSSGPDSGRSLRIELYRRITSRPRARFENLYEHLNYFPEAEPDRVRFNPTRSEARGLELFLRAPLGSRTSLWVTYTYASTRDRIDGQVVPRLYDQRHAATVDINLPLGTRWRLNAAWRYHSGWPVTALSLRATGDPDAPWAPLLGPLNGDRLPGYHRLDLRLSRRWNSGRVALQFYLDVQNAYGRENLAGFDFEVDTDAGRIDAIAERWPGVLPSVGLNLEF